MTGTGVDVTRGTTGMVDATSAGEEVGVTTGTTGTEVATSAGEVATGVAVETGLVTVQGQLVIVRVVAWTSVSFWYIFAVECCFWLTSVTT